MLMAMLGGLAKFTLVLTVLYVGFTLAFYLLFRNSPSSAGTSFDNMNVVFETYHIFLYGVCTVKLSAC